jgi:hypothetical protein
MLHHLLHDEWVADYETQHPRSALAASFSQDLTVISANELHEAG